MGIFVVALKSSRVRSDAYIRASGGELNLSYATGIILERKFSWDIWSNQHVLTQDPINWGVHLAGERFMGEEVMKEV